MFFRKNKSQVVKKFSTIEMWLLMSKMGSMYKWSESVTPMYICAHLCDVKYSYAYWKRY